MGKTYSKEEVVVAQNANGEANASAHQSRDALTVAEVLLIVVVVILSTAGIYFILKKCQNAAVKTLRRELNAHNFSAVSRHEPV